MFLGGLVLGLACALTGVLGGCILCLWMFRNDGPGGGGDGVPDFVPPDWDRERV